MKSPDFFFPFWLKAARTMDSKEYLPNGASAPTPLEAANTLSRAGRISFYSLEGYGLSFWASTGSTSEQTIQPGMGILWVSGMASVYIHSPSSGIWHQREVTAETVHFHKLRICSMVESPGFNPHCCRTAV